MTIQWKQIGEQLLVHIEYSFLAILFATIIGIIIAVLIFRYKWISAIFVQTAGILQTIPSIAIFGVLIPFVPNLLTLIVITLTAYGLFPIISNTTIGLKKISNETLNVAKSLALSPLRILFSLRFRIGLPTIIGGIRISATLIIGVAAIAAIIGGGGLGELILTGINRRDISLVMQGTLPLAAISIIVAILLRYCEKVLSR